MLGITILKYFFLICLIKILTFGAQRISFVKLFQSLAGASYLRGSLIGSL